MGRLAVVESNPVIGPVLNVAVFFTRFLIMLHLYKDFLKSQWQEYRKNLWLKLLLNVVLVVGVVLILELSRKALPLSMSIQANNVAAFANTSLFLALLDSVMPFIAPFAEELTFRYLLFGKINNKLLKGLMLFVSSILLV